MNLIPNPSLELQNINQLIFWFYTQIVDLKNDTNIKLFSKNCWHHWSWVLESYIDRVYHSFENFNIDNDDKSNIT
jgi:hypothetical protein